jgi:hypothetical protein
MLGAIAAISAGLGIGNALFGGGAEKSAKKQAGRMSNQALARTELSNVLSYRDRIMDANAPFMEAIAQGNALAGMAGAQRAQAGMSRMGLGNTGLGASVGAGLQAGANFQTNQLRARMQADAFRQAQNIAQMQAGTIMQRQIVPQSSAFERFTQGAGAGMTALSPFMGGAPTGGNPVMANIGGQQQSIADWYRG